MGRLYKTEHNNHLWPATTASALTRSHTPVPGCFCPPRCTNRANPSDTQLQAEREANRAASPLHSRSVPPMHPRCPLPRNSHERPYARPSVLLPKSFTNSVATRSPSPVFSKPCLQFWYGWMDAWEGLRCCGRRPGGAAQHAPRAPSAAAPPPGARSSATQPPPPRHARLGHDPDTPPPACQLLNQRAV